MSIISGFNKVKNYVKTTEGYKLLSRWTSSDTVDVNGKTLTEVVDELGTASKKDVAASGNASTTQVVMGNDTRLTDARKASDVSAWAKASTKPTYTASEVGAYTKTETDTKLNGKANSSHSHGNGDITSLDASKITSGTISIDRLPQGALERLTVVADDTARFKLTSSTIQKGDTVKVTSSGKMYYVVDETKLSSEAGYEVYAAGTAASVPWSGVTGKPSTYTPSSHTHTKSQIIDFPTSMPANGGTADNSNHVYSIDGSGTKRAMTMNWVGKDGQPSWLWGGVDGANMYVYNPNNFNVNYANSAGSAPANGGTSTYANYVYATSHQGSWYQNSQWDGTYFQTNYKYGDNVLPMKVGYAGYADSAGSVAWSDVSGRPSSMPASDVYSWAKASSKPSYTASEVGAAPANHTHSGYATTTTTDSLQSQITTINSNLTKNGNYVVTFSPKSQGNIKVFGTVYLPNAAKWNIALTRQNLCGVATNANFTINRFTVEIYDDSFLIYSSDSDVKSWFQDGAIYVFTFNITHK